MLPLMGMPRYAVVARFKVGVSPHITRVHADTEVPVAAQACRQAAGTPGVDGMGIEDAVAAQLPLPFACQRQEAAQLELVI